MGTTRAYKNIRLLTHLMTLLIIIANVILFLEFVCEHRFFQVENNLNLGIFNLQTCFKYTIIINIILALFGACTVNSKVKFYVRIYLILGFLGLCMLVSFYLFVFLSYRGIFDNQFSYQIGQNATIRYIVRSTFNCSEYGSRDCLAIMKEKVNCLIQNYSIISGICFVLTFIVYILGRIVLFIDVSVPDRREKPPQMLSKVHMGYDSGSLRTRRLVDPNIRYTGSVLQSNN